eukprot:9793995-Lingulodinium_polyedra.AAC.1
MRLWSLAAGALLALIVNACRADLRSGGPWFAPCYGHGAGGLRGPRAGPRPRLGRHGPEGLP